MKIGRFLVQRRFISDSSNVIFMSETQAIPMANITMIYSATYTKEFMKKHAELDNVEFGDKVVYIKRTDGWFHWITEKGNPKLYNELVNFLRNGYTNQFSQNDEVKQALKQQPVSAEPTKTRIRYEPYAYQKDRKD